MILYCTIRPIVSKSHKYADKELEPNKNKYNCKINEMLRKSITASYCPQVGPLLLGTPGIESILTPLGWLALLLREGFNKLSTVNEWTNGLNY